MTRQVKIGRQRVEEEAECGQQVGPDELAYVVEATRYVEALERSFGEAYRDGQLGLELYFRVVNDEFVREFREDSAVLYGFRGLIGPEHPSALVNKFPREVSIKSRDSQHVVLVAVRELMQMNQGMPVPSLGLHLIRLEPFNQANGLPVDSENPALFKFATEVFGGLADRKLMHKPRGLAFAFDEFLDDVVESGAKIVNNVPGDRREFERWLVDDVEYEATACAVVGITFAEYRRVRSTIQVRDGFSLEPVKVIIGIP